MNKIEQIDTIANRISYALSLKGMRAVDLAKKAGIPKSSLSQYMTGFVEPKSDRIFAMAKALGVSEGWLMGLDVPIERAKVKDVSSDMVADFIMDNEVQTLVEYFNGLDAEDRKFLLEFAKKLQK